MNTFAERLKAAMAHAGLSQSELARRVGIRQQSICALLQGRAVGTQYGLQIAKHCGVRVEWLMTGEGLMTNDEAPLDPTRDEYTLIHMLRGLHPSTREEVSQRIEQEYQKALEIIEQWNALQRTNH